MHGAADGYGAEDKVGGADGPGLEVPGTVPVLTLTAGRYSAATPLGEPFPDGAS
jgi:hypothetical protein